MPISDLIDPEIAPLLAALPALDGFSAGQLPAMREARLAQLAQVRLSDAVERTDHLVPGGERAPPVRVRVHRPRGVRGPLPCLLFMHGGGYVIGSHRMDDQRFDRWCPALGCVGVSVDYRLAPECPYPGPLEDCYAALQWAHAQAHALGIDPARIGIGGASAGGGLAAGLALLARDRGGPAVAFQLLIYPMLDDRMRTRSSQWQVPVWTPASNRAGWSAYLGDLASGEVPHHAAAARASDLSGLPPAQILVGAIDGFLDEDVDYAQRLLHASVPTDLHVFAGAHHGFDSNTPDVTVARRAREIMEAWLAQRMAQAGGPGPRVRPVPD